METLQREGRALFERSTHGGTLNISSAYHRFDMAENAVPYLGFEWEGVFYCFEVLPFGQSSAPWIFSALIFHDRDGSLCEIPALSRKRPVGVP